MTNGESLEVTGSVEVYLGATLDASYTGSAGYLKGSAARVMGTGTVSLPYLGTGGSLPEGGSYTTAEVAAVRAAGWYITFAAAGSALDTTGVEAIFKLEGGPDALTVGGITGLTAAAVPEGKTLTLTGAENTVVANTTVAGTLIVAEDAKLAIGGSGIEIKASTAGNITINGTLDLTNAGDTVAGKLTNNGTVKTKATAAATQKSLLMLPGDGINLNFIGTETLTAKQPDQFPVLFTVYLPPAKQPVFIGAQKVYDLV